MIIGENMANIEGSTLAQQIAEYISSEIVTGNLKPGQRLLEESFKDFFGTSRAPVREAFFMLEQKGIVEKIARKGVFVKKYSKQEVLDFYAVVYEITRFSIETAIQKKLKHFNFKHCLELLDKLQSNIESQNKKECFTNIEQIHEQLILISDNKVLIDVYYNLNLQWTTLRYLTLSHPESLTKSHQEYLEIVKNIRIENMGRIIEILDRKKSRALGVLTALLKD